MKALREELLASHRRVGSPRRLLIGLSGGADSLALALALAGLREELQLQLSCVHVHHGLRASADRDEAFVRSFCEDRALPLQVMHVQVSRQGSMEAAAREARYKAFEEARMACGAELLVLGHHRDDQAETVLMRLLRGSGPTGLMAMRELSHGVWRPLLGIGAEQLRRALQEIGQPFCEDESNQDPRHLRNALRLQALPLLEKLVPGSIQGLARSASILSAENAYWDQFVSGWLLQHASTRMPCLFALVEPLLLLPLAARRRVLRGLCAAHGLQPDFAQVERLDALLEAPPIAWTNLSDGIRAMRSRHRLHLTPPKQQKLPLGELVQLDQPVAFMPKQSLTQAVNLQALEGAVFRHRLPGDLFRPIHAGGSKPLGEYMIDQGVDRPFRDHWPVLARGEELLWLPGISLGDGAAVREGVGKAGMIRYLGRLPDQLNTERMQEG